MLSLFRDPALARLMAKPGVQLLKRDILSIDPVNRRVTTDDGVFEANGFTAGSVTITGEAGTVSASAKLSTTVEIAENNDEIAENERTALTRGGAA